MTLMAVIREELPWAISIALFVANLLNREPSVARRMFPQAIRAPQVLRVLARMPDDTGGDAPHEPPS